MNMVSVPEDPIEAIKRRNEERARKLKERIAAGEFFGFGEAIDEIGEGTPSQPAETTSEFDLSSFPPPPDIETVDIGGSSTASAPEGLEIQLTPPVDETAIFRETTPITEERSAQSSTTEGFPPPPEATGVPEIEISGLVSEEMPGQPPPEDFGGISFDGDDYGDFPIPETWGGEEALTVSEPELEVTKPVQIQPETITARAEQPGKMSVQETPEAVVTKPELTRQPEPAVVPEPVKAEPVVQPEPAVVPEPVRTPEPVISAKPETVQKAAVAAELGGDHLVIKIDIEVHGTNVKVRRENIGMEGTIELFKRIVEKYEKGV